MSPDGPNFRSPQDPGLDELAGAGVEVLDTAAAGALVLADEADEVLADNLYDDLYAPEDTVEAGGPPAPAGGGQDG